MAIAIESYQRSAKKLYDTYKGVAGDAARADSGWSVEGAKDVAARALATYKAEMSRLQDGARAEVERARAANARERTEAFAKESTRRRVALGDAVYADVVRRRAETLDSNALIKAIDNAPTTFERELLRAYAETVIAQRMSADAPTAADRSAHEALQEHTKAITAEFDEAAEELEHPRWIRALDGVQGDDERARNGEVYKDF